MALLGSQSDRAAHILYNEGGAPRLGSNPSPLNLQPNWKDLVSSSGRQPEHAQYLAVGSNPSGPAKNPTALHSNGTPVAFEDVPAR